MHEACEEAASLINLWCRTLQRLPDEQAAVSSTYLLWAPSGSKQEKWAKMERVGRNGMSAPQIVVVNHEAPRSCPLFRNHL